jgi:hypothetical protein
MKNRKELANSLDEHFAKQGDPPPEYARIGFGVDRTVYKKIYDRFVVKFDKKSSANKSEYALYKGLEDYSISSKLASCYALSDSGRILIQEFVPGSIPCISYEDDDLCKKTWASLDTLASHFDFIGKFEKSNQSPCCDFHVDNLRVCRDKSTIKIVDYAAILIPLVLTAKLDTVIKRLKKFYPKYKMDFDLYLDADKAIIVSKEPDFYYHTNYDVINN